MSYLPQDKIEEISEQVTVIPFEKGYKIQEFDCGNPEYNSFLVELAEKHNEYAISSTHLLINKKNADIIGYIALSNDSIKLLDYEKDLHGLSDVEFGSIPALKIGKLAVDKRYAKNGYGSFLIDVARFYAVRLKNIGTACRFLTVDADVESDSKLVRFYGKNGFKKNEHKEYTHKTKLVSMRLCILSDPKEETLDKTGSEN